MSHTEHSDACTPPRSRPVGAEDTSMQRFEGHLGFGEKTYREACLGVYLLGGWPLFNQHGNIIRPKLFSQHSNNIILK